MNHPLQSLTLQGRLLRNLRHGFELVSLTLQMFVGREPKPMSWSNQECKLFVRTLTYKAHQIRFQTFWSRAPRKVNFDLDHQP